MVLRRIGVWSSARMAGAIYAVLGLIFGVLFAMFSVIGGVAAASSDDMPAFVAAMFGVGAVVLLPIMYGFFGLLGGAIAAALYNLFSGIVGGVEVEFQPEATAARPL